MDMLHKEGCHDMVMWLQLMNTETSPRKSEISFLLSASASGASSTASNTPKSANSLSPQPPSATDAPRPPYRQHSPNGMPLPSCLPNSPYTWYFDENGKVNGTRDGINQI
jgi:hypothetical protein